ncbi:MAG TPA: DUF547 domain-containing protein [Usitatibacter sp.]|nr:DUF547 domain-containing protein [Usitatibacter sp.]
MARVLAALVALLIAVPALAFDHGYRDWDALLKKHVRYVESGNASRVSYAGFARDRAGLKAVLDGFSGVPRSEFEGWTKPQRQAFLVNAYNAFTIEKVLTRHPDLKSIRDFGTVFGNPWKDRFFTLLGEPSWLDRIEHEMLRKEGDYDDPRVHVAVVCASIGCPMLRNEAFLPEKLDAQLEDAMRRFFSDRTRNRYDARAKRLELSRIFDWYGKDFEKGHRGFASVKATAARYADQLADGAQDRAAIRAQHTEIAFLEYDWTLNDADRAPGK